MISYKIITEDVDIKNAVENERKVRHSNRVNTTNNKGFWASQENSS